MTRKKPRKWTKEALLKSASKYTAVRDWRTKEPSAYATASQQNMLPELTAHMKKLIVHGYWTEERILDSAKKFDQISKWAETYDMDLQSKILFEFFRANHNFVLFIE